MSLSTDVMKKLPATVKSDSRELESQIRLRAYQLYEERGMEDGHDLEDWLRAEAEMAEKKVRTVAA